MLPYRVYQAQVEAIRRLEKEAPCIFVGCCANEVLKDEENVLRVFIYASDMEERIERISSCLLYTSFPCFRWSFPMGSVL